MSPALVRKGVLVGSLFVSGALPLVAVAAVFWGLRVPAPGFGPFSFWTLLCLLAAFEAAAGFAVSSFMLRRACALNGDSYPELMRAFILAFPLPLRWAQKYTRRWEQDERQGGKAP